MIASLLLGASIALASPASGPPVPDPEETSQMFSVLGAYRTLCRDRTQVSAVALLMARMVLGAIDPVAVAEGERDAPDRVRRLREAGDEEIADFCARVEPVIKDINAGPAAPNR